MPVNVWFRGKRKREWILEIILWNWASNSEEFPPSIQSSVQQTVFYTRNCQLFFLLTMECVRTNRVNLNKGKQSQGMCSRQEEKVVRVGNSFMKLSLTNRKIRFIDPIDRTANNICRKIIHAQLPAMTHTQTNAFLPCCNSFAAIFKHLTI